jgi:hypothetical protein
MYKSYNCDKTIEEKLLEPGCMKREYWLYLRGVAFTLVLVSSLSDGPTCSCKYNSIDN